MAESAEESTSEACFNVDKDWKESVAREKEELRRKERAAQSGASRQAVPEPDIQHFMAGLYTQTLMALGMVENPITGEKGCNLPEAQYLIDTIAMLREKTRGNLSADEDSYVEGILYDLRMRYVSATREEAAAESDPEGE